MQAIKRIDRRSMVIGTFGSVAPVAHDQIQVEKPALHFGFAVPDGLHSPVAEADR